MLSVFLQDCAHHRGNQRPVSLLTLQEVWWYGKKTSFVPSKGKQPKSLLMSLGYFFLLVFFGCQVTILSLPESLFKKYSCSNSMWLKYQLLEYLWSVQAVKCFSKYLCSVSLNNSTTKILVNEVCTIFWGLPSGTKIQSVTPRQWLCCQHLCASFHLKMR